MPYNADKSAIEQARDALFVDTAWGYYLTRIGTNHGVPRPDVDPDDDVRYRKIIQYLAWQPNTTIFTFYGLLESVFGTQAEIVAAGGRAWAVYEVNHNEIILEIPRALSTGTSETAAYFHGHGGAFSADGIASALTTPGDITSASANWFGPVVYALVAGVWTAYPCTAASYSSVTGLTTFSVSIFPPALVGVPGFVDVAGDGTFSYEGDFMAPDATGAADGVTPATVEHDRRPYLFGNGALDIVLFYTAKLARAAGIVLRVEMI